MDELLLDKLELEINSSFGNVGMVFEQYFDISSSKDVVFISEIKLVK